MKTLKLILCLMICSGIIVSAQAEQTNKTTKSGKIRIGIYDSRAIAVAFAGTKPFNVKNKKLMDKYEAAKAAKDKKLITELKAEGKAGQEQLHKQGFGTASVSNILEYIKDELPEITKKADVEIIVSKWDEATLSKYKSAEQVDVTMSLVDAFKPNAKQRKSAIEIQKHPPISTKKLDKILEKGCH